jgi:hypothetical protein
MKIADLFLAAGLSPLGPVVWNVRVEENARGVYVVTVDTEDSCLGEIIAGLSEDHRARWVDHESIIYIGQTTSSLRKRINQFYRHKFEKPSPHAGGRRVFLLNGCRKLVYCSPTDEPKMAEQTMIETFLTQTDGRLPFANNVRPRKPRY